LDTLHNSCTPQSLSGQPLQVEAAPESTTRTLTFAGVFQFSGKATKTEGACAKLLQSDKSTIAALLWTVISGNGYISWIPSWVKRRCSSTAKVVLLYGSRSTCATPHLRRTRLVRLSMPVLVDAIDEPG
jgi:hypothetical protein